MKHSDARFPDEIAANMERARERKASGPSDATACSPFSVAEVKRLATIAGLVDAEAQTWKEGFAAYKGDGQWDWTNEYPEIHARVVRLESAVAFLRKTQCRLMKANAHGQTPPQPTPQSHD